MKTYIYKIIKFISSILGLYSKSVKLNCDDDFIEKQLMIRHDKVNSLVSCVGEELEKDIQQLEKQYQEIGIVNVISSNETEISKTINIKDKFLLNKNLLITINYFIGKTEITEDSLTTNIETSGHPTIKINDKPINSSFYYYGLKGGHEESIASRYNCRKRRTKSFFGSNWGGGGDTGNTHFPADKLTGTDVDSFLKDILKTGLSISKSDLNGYKKSVASISSSLTARINENEIGYPNWEKYRNNFPPIEISAISGGKQFFYFNAERFLIKLSGDENALNLNVNLSECPYIKKCVIVIETCSKYFQ